MEGASLFTGQSRLVANGRARPLGQVIAVPSNGLEGPDPLAYAAIESEGPTVEATETLQESAGVIELRPLKAAKASERKWGRPAMVLGFCIIPSLLLRAQQRLGLNPTQLAVLLHLADYWWDADRRPFPKKETSETGSAWAPGRSSATSRSWKRRVL